jgi:hypothetical protein
MLVLRVPHIAALCLGAESFEESVFHVKCAADQPKKQSDISRGS